MTPLDALTIFAFRRPRLDPALYANDHRAYRQDARRVTQQLADFRAALAEFHAAGVDPALLPEAARRAYSGRVEFRRVANGWEISYTAGQYAPTEYRQAAAAVLKQALHEHRLAHPQPLPDGQDLPQTLEGMRALNQANGGHYFDNDACRYFGSRFHECPFPGCVIESVKPPYGARFFRAVFVQRDGSIRRDPDAQFPSVAKARAYARQQLTN